MIERLFTQNQKFLKQELPVSYLIYEHPTTIHHPESKHHTRYHGAKPNDIYVNRLSRL